MNRSAPWSRFYSPAKQTGLPDLPQGSGGIGITLKIALLAWLVTLVTLLTFVIVIIPQQKQTFRQNLTSKARSVAVSLQEVTQSALVSKDYSSVVQHCVEMLKGDRTIEFLVLAKNDGFSLIHDRTSWSQENDIPLEWRPAQRETMSRIHQVERFNRRVFHYSQPFDYSSIQWGWIHVGLSLDDYDQSVAMVYRRTIFLAVICIGLSLLASVVYARRLVRPILSLHNAVQKVAAGDLAARAAMESSDEVGILANSFNRMTEALLRRDKILESVRFAAQQFLSASDWRESISAVLAKIGEAAVVSRIRVYENYLDDQHGLAARQCFEWSAPELRSTPDGSGHPDFHPRSSDLAPWVELLKRKEPVAAHLSQLEGNLRRLLEPLGFKSVFLAPILVEEDWWGTISLSDCQQERQWTDAERDSFRAAANMLGAAIARQRARDALLEGKATLEQRVQERTKELREQVAAKDRAHTALTETQQRLMQASRQAGMAEVATGVLHNVGNVLNSVNVSTNLISDRIRQSKTASLSKAAQLLRQHEADLASFITQDARGKLLVPFLITLSHHLEQERAGLLQEMELLVKNVDHIKNIVAMQQSYAKVSGVMETLPVDGVVEDALQMNAAALDRHQIQIVRDYQQVPLVTFDKHKVLQILLNLIRNAKYALEDKPGPDQKQLRVSISPQGPGRVKIAVQDNGVGIPAENLTRMFSHGFTTRKDGHGFGLHVGALAAREMGGSLCAFSDGAGHGATFVLELPAAPHEVNGL